MIVAVADTHDPLTRPAPADESAVAGHPLPQGGEGCVCLLPTAYCLLLFWAASGLKQISDFLEALVVSDLEERTAVRTADRDIGAMVEQCPHRVCFAAQDHSG